MHSSRERFPGLDEWVRLDGPAGTLPVDTSIDAMHAYLTSSAPANTGGAFAASRETTGLVETVREQVGALLGAQGSQVIFGPSATALVFAYTRALARTWTGSERIICTQLDHDSNVTPWVEAARDVGATVTTLPIDPSDGTLDLADLERELHAGGVAWVAMTGASNLTGWAPDVRAALDLSHAAGARIHIDAVARAPHLPINVNAWGIDSLVTSPYKWYGPHAGVLCGDPALLDALPAAKVRPAADTGPRRWETGTPNFEAIAAIAAAAEFLLDEGLDRIGADEARLGATLLDGLGEIDGVRLWGPATMDHRVPTFAFTVDGQHPDDVAAALAAAKVAAWSGHNVAVETVDQLGLADSGGVVRVGVVAYVDDDDVERLLTAVRALG